MQHLAPGQTADMGVVFFVDPEIVSDPQFDRIDTITLSYTMFEADAPVPETALNTTETPVQDAL
jgi:cytochrome c oxidase assembly protein subunit 11